MERDIERLSEKHGGYWGEHPKFPHEDWSVEAVNNDTRLGYWEWVESKLQRAADDGDEEARTELASCQGEPDPDFFPDPLDAVRAERDRLVEQLQAQGGRGVELADRIDELNEQLGEGEETHSFKVGDQVWWDDPDEGACSGLYRLESVGPEHVVLSDADSVTGAMLHEIRKPTEADRGVQ